MFISFFDTVDGARNQSSAFFGQDQTLVLLNFKSAGIRPRAKVRFGSFATESIRRKSGRVRYAAESKRRGDCQFERFFHCAAPD
jgi:hypothetical protein